MIEEDRLNRVLAGISHTGYTTELERYEARNLLEEQNKEIDRLNNIINELEKSWKEQQEYYRYRKDNRYRSFLSKNLDKLKELKESVK